MASSHEILASPQEILSGGLVSARGEERVSGVPAAAGLARIGQLHHVRSGGLIATLDAGGYARCDFRTAAARLPEPSEMAGERNEGQVTVTGRSFAAHLQPRAGWERSARLGPGGRAVTAARALKVTGARLCGEGPGRAGTRARPGMPTGRAGACPRPGPGLLPGLHGAAAGQP